MTLVSDAAIQADATEYRTHTKALAELQPLVEKFREYKTVVEEVAQTQELSAGNDVELKELADQELRTLEPRRENLLDEIKILLIPKDPNDEDLLIYENDIFLIKRLHDKEKGDMALAKFILPKDAPREFLIPLSVMRSKEELGKLLATQGIVMMSKQLDAMMVYLIACTKNQQTQAEAEIMRVQFGWVDEDNKFILGDKEIGLKTIKYSPPSPATESLCQWIQPKGDLEEWKKVISVYDQDNFEPHCFGLFTAFGAPLMKHLGFNGALINLINSSSGTGKSTILKVCNSVYGHPDKLLAQETDTFAHKMFRLGIMNNMPFTIDEVTNMEPAIVSKLLYNVSQGTGPGRMQSQTNIERKNDTSWSLIALASANSSMAEKLGLIKQFADGELMRLLEYRIDQTNNISKSDAYSLFEGTMLHNYGLAGPAYIKWLVRNLGTAVDLTRGMQKTLDRKVNLNAKERFWSAVISCNITGAHIAKTLNLIDIDVVRVLMGNERSYSYPTPTDYRAGNRFH